MRRGGGTVTTLGIKRNRLTRGRYTYAPIEGPEDTYDGSISKIGLDVDYTEGATIIYDVVAATPINVSGALAGTYGGATANARLIAGTGVNVLAGGFDRSIALRPVSVMGDLVDNWRSIIQ